MEEVAEQGSQDSSVPDLGAHSEEKVDKDLEKNGAAFRALVEHACIRVLVVPIGKTPVSKLEKQLRTLLRFSRISRGQVTPFGDLADLAFESQRDFQGWAEGDLRFHFQAIGEADDDQSLGRLGWYNLQPHRRIAAILGVCDWPSVERDIESALSEFQCLVDKFSERTVARWCAFNMTDPQSLDDGVLNSLIERGMEYFDVEKVYEDGTSSYNLRMEMVLCNMSTKILEEFNKIIKEGLQKVGMLATKQSAGTNLEEASSDPFMDIILRGATFPGDKAASQKLSDSKSRKRMSGRVQAWIAGHALLAGSPRDALDLYNAAIKDSASANDGAWEAVALEGSASALYLASSLDDYLGDVSGALKKSASIYAKVPGFWKLQAECALKYASYAPNEREHVIASLSAVASKQLSIAQKGGSGRGPRPPMGLDAEGREEFKSNFLERQQKEAALLFRNVALQSALLFEQAGFIRKSSFFLHLAASHEPNWMDALRLMQRAAERIGIAPRFTVREDTEKGDVVETDVAWKTVRQFMLQSLVEAAQNAGEGQLAVDYVLQLFNILPKDDEFAQKEVYEIISSSISMNGFSFLEKTCPFPCLEGILLPDASPELQLFKRHRVASKTANGNPSGGLFYSPFASANGAAELGAEIDKIWVQNEISSVSVLLSNPTAIPIRVDAISLDISPTGAMECHRMSLTLRPREKRHRLFLSVRPLVVGEFVIQGCEISALGLRSRHAISLPFKVQVVQAMPYISFEHLTHRQVVALESPIDLYEGEEFPIECEMHSTSGVHITECKFDAFVSFEPPNAHVYRHHVVPQDYDSAHLEEIIRAFGDSPPVQNYSRHDSRRESIGEPNDTISDASSESSVAEYRITSSTTIESQRNKVLQVVLGLEESSNRIESAMRKLGGTLCVPQRFRLRILAQRGCTNATIQIAYSADELSMERRFRMAFELNVLPSMQVLHLDVLPDPAFDEGKSRFLLVLDIRNNADISFALEAYDIEAQESRPVTLEVLPISIHRLVIQFQNENVEPVDDVLSWVSARFRLDWRCKSSSSRGGLLTVNNAVVSKSAAAHLNSGILRMSLECLKESSELLITVRNLGKDRSFDGLSVNLLVKRKPALAMIAWDGSLSVHIDRLGPGEEHNYKLGYKLLRQRRGDGELDDEKTTVDFLLVADDECCSQRSWSMDFESNY